ncbi:hypothetical protein [Asticcacaulis machinosus]|uniref:Uncharacterized protein n=1 Tax=Asticcacaulis machinosus TaxID=2984211 RepID=A0ABT5HHL8_9CAUL|nr:hypothetical protein [Asticcacaulis machinosus]MDC7675740.1 hypothetical protein [Asticcacaulis machinosus]
MDIVPKPPVLPPRCVKRVTVPEVLMQDYVLTTLVEPERWFRLLPKEWRY